MASKTKKKDEPVKRVAVMAALGWTVLAGAWLFVATALVSYDPADWPGHTIAPHNVHPHNWAGPIGAGAADQVYLMIGPGVWVLMAGLATFLIIAARRKPVPQKVIRLVGLVLMSLAASALVGLGAMRAGDNGLVGTLTAALPGADRPEGAGGLVAVYVNSELVPRFNVIGTMVILTAAFWIGAVLAADEVVLALPKLLGRMVLGLKRIQLPRPALATGLSGVTGLAGLITRRGESGAGVGKRGSQRTSGNTSARGAKADKDDGAIDEDAGGLGATRSFDPDQGRKRRRGRAAVEDEPVEDAYEGEDEEDEYEYEDEVDDTDAVDEDDDGPIGDAPGAYVAEKRQFTPDELRAKIKKLPINFARKSAAPVPPPREIDLSGYVFPGLDLLGEPESNFTDEQERIVRDQAVLLESALQEYRIEGEVVAIDSGPVITLFEVRLAPGTKVSRLNTVSSDLARSLKAQNIRVVPNMAGKDTVGIEVPNLKKERVRLKELMTVGNEAVQKMKLPMFLGKDASGNSLIADLSSMPHMLIAGTTGSGKSVCMNSIIMSFLYTKRPDELKMVLVDPKMVELSLFKDMPHLMCPVVTEMSKAAAILEWAVTKMDERYELLAEAGVRDVAGYNSLSWQELVERFEPANEVEEAKIPKKLPYLVFVIDELADLMITNKEVEGFIVRIAQKARAVGIHLILATQRPQANVVTGLIKSNMPCRISFKVASGMDSRIVLDQKGAELLLGQGDMLYLSPRTSKLTRAQGTLVDDTEIRKVVRFLKEIAEQCFEPQLMQLKGPGAIDDDDGERDPLFDQAVEIVLETKRGSVSLLQRRLTIGYSRSSRLIEQMAAAGIIGEYKGSQAREVNLTLDEWEALKAQAEADAAAGQTEAAADDDEDADEDEEYEDEEEEEYEDEDEQEEEEEFEADD